MTQRWPWLLGLVVGASALFAGLASGPDSVEGWHLAARWTARAGMPLLLLTYSASSLARLSPAPLTKALLRDRRWWGLGFATSHSLHLVALVTYTLVAGITQPLPTIVVGGLAYALLYAMALTSNDAAMRALGRNWKRLHTVGIHLLWFIFFIDMARDVAIPERQQFGLPALVLVLGALGLRIAAARKARAKRAVA